jgi:predicted ABC-type transport system involved in lysophospholipase L1 biosynthesis ATPase subunit
MSELLLEFEQVAGSGFGSCSCRLDAGGLIMVDAESSEVGMEWTELAAGLRSPSRGVVRLFGEDLSALREDDRLALLQDVGYAGTQGHLIANLKLWENLILPVSYRMVPDLVAAEALILEAFAVAGLEESWVAARLAKTPDHLSPFESRVAGLVRAAVSRPRLLLAEFLFDGVDESTGSRLTALVRWMRDRQPEMGVVVVRRSEKQGRFSLIPEGGGGIIKLREEVTK